MSPVQADRSSSWRGGPARLALALALLLAGAHTAPATAQTPEAQQAAAIAVAAVNAASGACGATVDPSLTRVQASDPLKTTVYRPAGFDVTVSGTAGSRFSARSAFNSAWLVANGQALPRNLPAARLAAGCGAPPANPRTPQDWYRLTHLDPGTGEIQVGRPGFEDAVLNAKLRKQIGDAGPMEESQAPVWAAKCKPGVQYVSFTRNVELLGPPESMSVWVRSVSAGLRRSPINATGVYINGQPVATLLKRGILDVTLGERERNLIQFGRNRITVVARKEKTGSCNAARGKRQLGITFSIQGKQAWRTTATRPAPQAYPSPLTPIPYTVTNLGPSVLLEPVFTLTGYFRDANLLIVGPNASGAGATCTTNDARSAAICGLEPMPAGATRTIDVVLAASRKDRPPNDTAGEYTSWQAEWDFHGATDRAPGSYCIPPAGQSDCRSLGG